MRHKLKAVVTGGRRLFGAMTLALLATAGFWSCGDDTSSPIDDMGGTRPMLIQPGSILGTKSLPTTINGATGSNRLDSIGVFGYHTGVERWAWSVVNQPDSLFANRILNMKLKRENSWQYSPLQYWPIDARNKMSFFAYAPAMDTATMNDPNYSGGLIPLPLTDSIASFPQVQFAVDTIINRQLDLLWSRSLDKTWKDNNGVVEFAMQHGLAGVKFTAQLADGELAKGYTARIVTLGLFEVHGKGNMRLDNGVWTFNDSPGNYYGQYVMKIEQERLRNVDITGRNFNPLAVGSEIVHDLLEPDMGFLMLLPQDIASNPYAMIAMEIEFGRTGVDPVRIPFPVMLAGIEDSEGVIRPWVAGEIIEYRLMVTDEFITIRTMSYDWKNVDTTGVVIL